MTFFLMVNCVNKFFDQDQVKNSLTSVKFLANCSSEIGLLLRRDAIYFHRRATLEKQERVQGLNFLQLLMIAFVNEIFRKIMTRSDKEGTSMQLC